MLDYETIRNFAEEIIANHDWESMEAVLYQDGDYWIRQSGSTGNYESEIMVTIPLGKTYWDESYFWGEDLDENEELRETAIADVVEDIYFEIEDWKAQEDERKKMREYWEAERKALEDMIGFQRNCLRLEAEELLERLRT